MAQVCPTCGKLLEFRKEMRADEMGTRGMKQYFWCNNCRLEVKNPETKQI